MANRTLNTGAISALMRPLVLSGIYKSEVDALQGIVHEFIKQKIVSYKKQTETFETKYKLTFDIFSEKLANNTSLELDDDWFEWKAAIEMSKAWNVSMKHFEDVHKH